MSSVITFFRELFAEKPCSGCIARDYHIASLKEQLRHYQQICENEIKAHHDDMNDIIKHITGMNRIQQQSTGELHSIRRSSGIADRIRRAEVAEASPEKMEQRRKEYDARIASLERPEMEVLEQKDQLTSWNKEAS